MDTAQLEAAYRDLLAGAAGPFRPPADAQRWSAERHLAHVVAVDRLLIGVTTALLAGAPRAAYDTTGADHGAALDLIARAADGLDGLVATLRQGGRELVWLVRRLDDATAVTPVATRLVSDGQVRAESPMPWSAVLSTHAEVDLPARTDALGALRINPTR